MPFREATALVAVEREGVIDDAGRDAARRRSDRRAEDRAELGTERLRQRARAARPHPRDAVVLVLHLGLEGAARRGAQSFWHDGRDYQAPTAMVDLAKPAFKLGVAELTVGLAAHELQVSVTTDKPQYAIREKAMRARCASPHGGKPLAGAEVAFAAVDEGLLALRDNESWKLLDAMMQRARLGRRDEHRAERDHRPAPLRPQGGARRAAAAAAARRASCSTRCSSGSRASSLDANGEATVEVPLNDSLTSFRLVAVADAGAQQFGTGSAQHPRHAGPAGARRLAAAGARRRPLRARC